MSQVWQFLKTHEWMNECLLFEQPNNKVIVMYNYTKKEKTSLARKGVGWRQAF